MGPQQSDGRIDQPQGFPVRVAVEGTQVGQVVDRNPTLLRGQVAPQGFAQHVLRLLSPAQHFQGRRPVQLQFQVVGTLGQRLLDPLAGLLDLFLGDLRRLLIDAEQRHPRDVAKIFLGHAAGRQLEGLVDPAMAGQEAGQDQRLAGGQLVKADEFFFGGIGKLQHFQEVGHLPEATGIGGLERLGQPGLDQLPRGFDLARASQGLSLRFQTAIRVRFQLDQPLGPLQGRVKFPVLVQHFA